MVYKQRPKKKKIGKKLDSLLKGLTSTQLCRQQKRLAAISETAKKRIDYYLKCFQNDVWTPL